VRSRRCNHRHFFAFAVARIASRRRFLTGPEEVAFLLALRTMASVHSPLASKRTALRLRLAEARLVVAY
jgi:hypothetical protein